MRPTFQVWWMTPSVGSSTAGACVMLMVMVMMVPRMYLCMHLCMRCTGCHGAALDASVALARLAHHAHATLTPPPRHATFTYARDARRHHPSAIATTPEREAMALLKQRLGEAFLSSPEVQAANLAHKMKLLRLVRGHGCDERAAETALRDAMAFRAEHGLDSVRQDLLAAGPGGGVPVRGARTCTSFPSRETIYI